MKVAFASERLDPVGRPQCQQNRYFDSITELQWEHVIIDETSVVIGPGESSARTGCGGTSVLIGFGATSVGLGFGKSSVWLGCGEISFCFRFGEADFWIGCSFVNPTGFFLLVAGFWTTSRTPCVLSFHPFSIRSTTAGSITFTSPAVGSVQ